MGTEGGVKEEGWDTDRGRYRKEQTKGGMMKFRSVEGEGDICPLLQHRHTHTHSTRAAGQNRALIVLEETNLTLVSEVMSSSAKQQRFFIALLHSLCASVCVFVCGCLLFLTSTHCPTLLLFLFLLLH